MVQPSFHHLHALPVYRFQIVLDEGNNKNNIIAANNEFIILAHCIQRTANTGQTTAATQQFLDVAVSPQRIPHIRLSHSKPHKYSLSNAHLFIIQVQRHRILYIDNKV